MSYPCKPDIFDATYPCKPHIFDATYERAEEEKT